MRAAISSRRPQTQRESSARALRRLAAPEGHGGRLAVGVFDVHAASGFDGGDAPGGVAELDDVADAGVDGEVLVESGDLVAVGLEDDGDDGGVGDGAAVRDGDGARAAACLQAAVDAVAEDVGAVAATRGLDAVREQAEEFFEGLARQIAIGMRAGDEREEVVLLPGLGGAGGDHLLHEDIERLRWDLELVERTGAQAAHDRGELHEVVAGGGEEARLGNGAAPMAGAAGALQCGREGARRVDLADEIDGADVDAELERSGGDEQLDLAGLEFALGFETQLARERAVVCGDVFRAEAFAELEGEPFGHGARVDEDEGAAVLERELGEAVVDVVPDGVGGDGAELVVGDFDGEIEVTAAADFDDGAVAVTCAAEEVGDERDGILRRGEADALWDWPSRATEPAARAAGFAPFGRSRLGLWGRNSAQMELAGPLRFAQDDTLSVWQPGSGNVRPVTTAAGGEAVLAADEGVESLEREHEVGAALVVGHGVDFVDDDGADAREIGARFFRGEQDEEGLRRGDEDVGRLLEHGAALGGERVAGADGGADGRAEIAALKGELLYLLQRLFEVLANVVGERFERRDVDDFGVRLELACECLTEELVDADEEGGECFAGAGGGGDERGPLGEDGRPAFDLRLGGGAEAGEKPLLEDGMGPCEGFGWAWWTA